jgi:hypothetical protein
MVVIARSVSDDVISRKNREVAIMSKDALKEEIKFLTEIFRLLSVAFLAIGGGTASLMLGMRTVWTVAFSALGVVVLVGLVVVLYYLQRHIRRLVKEV